MSKHYFRADLFSRTHLLCEIFVQIFAHFELLREIARKLVRAKISTNKVVHKKSKSFQITSSLNVFPLCEFIPLVHSGQDQSHRWIAEEYMILILLNIRVLL